MTSYQVAIGHNASAELEELDPQPNEDHAGGVQYARITRTANGALIKEGAYIDLTWSEMSADDYDAILTLFGLDAADNADVTILVRDDYMAAWVTMFGIAYRPLPGDSVRWNVRPRDAVIRVTDLVLAA